MCAFDRHEAYALRHFVVACAEPIGASQCSLILGNHDRPVPVQSSTIVNSGLQSVTFSPHDQDSIVQFYLFEYEMSRGLEYMGLGGPSPFLNHSSDFSFYFVIKTSVGM